MIRLWFALLGLLLAGCAAAALEPGDHEFVLTVQNLRRSYLVYVPPQAAAGKPMPVVLNFHGGGAFAAEQKRYSRMDEAAARDGYIAIYPNGSSGINGRLLTWNAGMCCGPAAELRVDDVGFVVALLEDLARRTPVDAARVYATGLSNGAMMAYRLAAEAPERIAAVAGVAGAMSVRSFAPALPVAVMHIHSVDDDVALYEGGLGRGFATTRAFHESVDAMLKKWVAHDGCPGTPQVKGPFKGRPEAADASHTAIRHVYGPCRGGSEVVLWKLTGAGHVWPGGLQNYLPALLGAGTTVIDANSEMWQFFSRFRREKRR